VNELMKNGGVEILQLGPVNMDLTYSRTVLYGILCKLLNDFKPRDEQYDRTLKEVLRQLKVNEPSKPQKKKTQRATKNRVT